MSAERALLGAKRGRQFIRSNTRPDPFATGAAFVLLTTTNVATPLALWTPSLTNQFDQFGAINLTNVLNPSERQRFFLQHTP